MIHDPSSEITTLNWSTPSNWGSSSTLFYDVSRASIIEEIYYVANEITDTIAVDYTPLPPPGALYRYVVVGANFCGDGDALPASDGTPRNFGVCP